MGNQIQPKLESALEMVGKMEALTKRGKDFHREGEKLSHGRKEENVILTSGLLGLESVEEGIREWRKEDCIFLCKEYGSNR